MILWKLANAKESKKIDYLVYTHFLDISKSRWTI